MQRLTATIGRLLIQPFFQLELKAWVVAGLVLCVALPSPLVAQNGAQPSPGASKQPAPKASPPGSKNPDPVELTGPPLPPSFLPPQSVPAEILKEKPLITEEQEAEYLKSKEYKGFLIAISGGREKKIVKNNIEFRLQQLTMLKYRGVLHEKRYDLVRKFLVIAGRKLTKPATTEAFRDFVMEEVTTQAEKLLDNNFYVQVQAVILMSELVLVKGDSRKKIDAVAYTPAAEVLLKIVNDANRPLALKILAVKGLKRISLIGKPDQDLRHRIADGLIAQLKNKETHFWYQMRAVEALGAVDLTIHKALGTPFIVQALVEIMIDKKRHPLVRTEAAKSLGRVPTKSEINVSLVAYEIAMLAHELALAYNTDNSKFYWRGCFFKLYLAFRPENAKEKAPPGGAGLLMKAKNVPLTAHLAHIKGAYEQGVLPLAKLVLQRKGLKGFSKATLAPMEAWLKANKPSNNKIAANLKPLSTGRVAAQ